jgi:hypothetical protein
MALCKRCSKYAVSGGYCVDHLASKSSSSSSSSSSSTSSPVVAQNWGSLATKGMAVKPEKLKALADLKSDVLDGKITWSDLIYAAHKHGALDIDCAGLSATEPADGMVFNAGMCQTPSGRPFTVASRLSKTNGRKSPGGPCHEASVFPGGQGVMPADEILLIHQSHAPCFACCRSFAGWAIHQGKPVVVAFEYGDGSDNLPEGQEGTYFFLPWEISGTTKAPPQFYFKLRLESKQMGVRLKPGGEERKTPV